MTDFLAACLAFPTVIWSVLLAFVVLYWAMVLLGALDLEILDGSFEWLDGGLEGAEGVGDVDGALDAGDLDAGGHGAGLLGALGLGGVPVTVALSLLVGLGWFLTFSGMELARGRNLAFLAGTWGALLVALLSAGLALVLAALAVKPLRPLFETRLAAESRDFVGKTCRITTLHVDEGFGQAELLDAEGASLVVQVRARVPNGLARGNEALIFHYDAERGVFLISSLDPQSSEGAAP